jgi:hypothetical protein
LHSIRDLKLLGWEQLLVNKNIEFRKEEIHLLRDFYLFVNIWDLVISLAPMIILLFVQVWKKFDAGSNLDTPSVYLVLSYIGLLYIPSKLFLLALVKGLEAK